MDNKNWETLDLKFENSELLCPQCDFNYLHIVKVIVARSVDEIIVEKDRVIVRKGGSPTRGNVIAMEYASECGHYGLIIFNFHKGNIQVWHRKLPQPKKHREDIYRD